MDFIDKNCWDINVLEDYFTTESRQKNETRFNETHLTIDKIQIIKNPPNISKSFISEEEFLKEVLLKTKIEADKKTYVFEGESGSGKSELCQWLEYSLSRHNRVPILFTRINTSIKQIFNKLSEHTGKNYKIEADLRVYQIKNLINFIKVKCELLHDEQINQPPVSREFQGDYLGFFKKIYESQEFIKFLKKNLKEYQSSESKLLKLYEPLKNNQIRSIIRRLKLRITNVDVDHFIPLIKKYLNKIFIKEFGSKEEINDILLSISKKYIEINKRVVLIFEDITSMGIYKDQILQFIFDKSVGKVDVVVGVTTGFVSENKLKESTYMDRADGFFSLTSEQGYTYFLEDNPENILKLTLKYMCAIKRNCENCEDNNQCFEIFGAYLFPFMEHSLIKIYENLIEDNVPKRTPRLFLEKVQKKILKDREFPFENPYIKEISGNFYSKTLETYPDIAKLFNVYGIEHEFDNEESIFLKVQEDILKFFSTELTPQIEEDLKIIRDNGFIIIESKKQKSEKSLLDEEEIEIEQKDKLEEKREKFNKWMLNGDTFKYAEDLRDGIVRILNSKYDFLKFIPTTSTAEIKYEYSKIIPIFIEDFDSRRMENIIRLKVPRNSANNVLDICYEYGISRTPEKFYSLTNRLDSAYLLFEWINENYSIYRDKIKSNIENDCLNGIELEIFAIFTKSFLHNLLFGKDILDYNNLIEDLNERKIFTNCKECGQYLGDIICLHCYSFSNPPILTKYLQDINANLEFFNGFFDIVFNLGKGIRNYNLLYKNYLKYKNDFEKIVKKIEKIDYSQLNESLYINLDKNKNIQLRKLFQILFQAFSDLKYRLKRKNLIDNISNYFKKLEKFSEYEKNFSEEELEQKITTLQTIFTESWRERWVKGLDLKICNFNDFFKLVKSNIDFIKRLRNKENVSIFEITRFIVNFAHKITISYEINYFNTLDEIFKKIESHKVIIENSDYQNNLEIKKEKEEKYINLLKEFKAELDEF